MVQATCDEPRRIVFHSGTRVAFLGTAPENFSGLSGPTTTIRQEASVMEEKPFCSPALDELRRSAAETIDSLVAAGVDLRTVPLCEVKQVLVQRVCERRRRNREADESPSGSDDDAPWRGESRLVGIQHAGEAGFLTNC